MFNSEFLQKFNLKDAIIANKYNFFYVSYNFTTIKEHILNTKNYPRLMPRLIDILVAIDVGLSSNIHACLQSMQNLLYLFKKEMYTLPVWELYELNILLNDIIKKHKDLLGSDLLESSNEQLHKEEFIIKLTEISDIINGLISINGGELLDV